MSLEEDYFDDIPDERIPNDMLDLASHIVKTKEGHFDPSKFDDRYEDALKDLLKKKQEGRPIERPERREPTNVVNLMDALRRSLEESGGVPASSKNASPARRGAAEKPEQPKRRKTKVS
jgi:DNA end-binding protein Ku